MSGRREGARSSSGGYGGRGQAGRWSCMAAAAAAAAAAVGCRQQRRCASLEDSACRSAACLKSLSYLDGFAGAVFLCRHGAAAQWCRWMVPSTGCFWSAQLAKPPSRLMVVNPCAASRAVASPPRRPCAQVQTSDVSLLSCALTCGRRAGCAAAVAQEGSTRIRPATRPPSATALLQRCPAACSHACNAAAAAAGCRPSEGAVGWARRTRAHLLLKVGIRHHAALAIVQLDGDVYGARNAALSALLRCPAWHREFGCDSSGRRRRRREAHAPGRRSPAAPHCAHLTSSSV